MVRSLKGPHPISQGNEWFFGHFKLWALVSALQRVKYLTLSHNLKEPPDATGQTERTELLHRYRERAKHKRRTGGEGWCQTSRLQRHGQQPRVARGRGRGLGLCVSWDRVSVWGAGGDFGDGGGDGCTVV